MDIAFAYIPLLHLSIGTHHRGVILNQLLDGLTGSEGDRIPMLEKIIAKARHLLKDARRSGSVESVAVIERMFNDIAVLEDFICKELSAVDGNPSLDEINKKAARRSILEEAGRKLENIKARKEYSELDGPIQAGLSEKRGEAEKINAILQFLQEKEVRDRLSGMTESQIHSFFGESLFDGSNPLLLNAILNSPTGFEPVSKKTLKKMQRARARNESPVKADKSPKVDNLSDTVDGTFRLVKKKLDDLRRNELPPQLVHSDDSKEPPFKF